MAKKNPVREPLPTTFAEAMAQDAPPVMHEPPPQAGVRCVEPEVLPPKGEETPTQQASNEAEKPEAPPPPPPPKKEEPAAPKAKVALDERGVALPTDLDGAFRVVGVLFRGKAFPNWVRSPEQAYAISQFLRALGLDVMTGIQHVCEVNGRLSLWGEGPLAVVRASGKMSKWREFYIDKDYKEICVKNKNLDAEIFAAVCESTRTDTGEEKQSWFSKIDEATANKGLDAVWKGYKRIMYKRKARAEHCKDLYGDVINAAGIAEYDFEQAPDMPTEPRKSLADQMNDEGGATGAEVRAQ